MIEAKLVKIEAVDEEFEHMLRVSGVTRSGEGHGSSQSGHDPETMAPIAMTKPVSEVGKVLR